MVSRFVLARDAQRSKEQMRQNRRVGVAKWGTLDARLEPCVSE
jgi:hypothetical protein